MARLDLRFILHNTCSSFRQTRWANWVACPELILDQQPGRDELMICLESWGSGQSKTQLRDYVALTGRFGMAEWYVFEKTCRVINAWRGILCHSCSWSEVAIWHLGENWGNRPATSMTLCDRNELSTVSFGHRIFSQVSVLEGLIKSTRTDIEEQFWSHKTWVRFTTTTWPCTRDASQLQWK